MIRFDLLEFDKTTGGDFRAPPLQLAQGIDDPALRDPDQKIQQASAVRLVEIRADDDRQQSVVKGILDNFAREEGVPLPEDRVETWPGGVGELARGGWLAAEEGLVDGGQVTLAAS